MKIQNQLNSNKVELFEQKSLSFKSEDVYEYIAIDLSPNLEYLAVGGLYLDNIVIWKFQDSQPQEIVLGTESNEDIIQVQFSIDSQVIAAASSSGSIKLWKTKIFRNPPIILSNHSKAVRRIQFFNQPNQELLCSVGDDGLMKVQNTNTLKLIYNCKIHETEINGLGISFDNKMIITSDNNGTIIIQMNQKIIANKQNVNPIFSISFPIKSRIYFVSSSANENVTLQTSKKIIRIFKIFQDWKWKTQFINNDQILIVSCINSLQLLDLRYGKLFKIIDNKFYTYPCFSYRNYNNKECLALGNLEMIKLWIK